MQTQKMSLANIQGKLSRAEMKNIMAGGGESLGCGCGSDADCGAGANYCSKSLTCDGCDHSGCCTH